MKFTNFAQNENAQSYIIKIDDLYVNNTVDDSVLSAIIENKISSQYVEFEDVFFEQNASELTKHDSQNHVIDINDKESSFDSMYNLSITKLEILRKYINDNFKKE